MVIIHEVLISDEIVHEQFLCDLSACKGACCHEGDYGAPVDQEEMNTLNHYLELIIESLPENSQEKIKNSGAFTYYKEPKQWGTACHEDGACVFLTKNEMGISLCGIEKTWKNGQIPFQKPISCHLYPLRVSKNEIVGFEAWNYDRWDICSAACTLGKKEKLPVYRFVKDAIIRLKGEDFYQEMDAAALHILNQDDL
ncbi:MAG: DUF3109 family protein [Saprospiraceae bacterium]